MQYFLGGCKMFGREKNNELSQEQLEIINKKHQIIIDRINLVNKLSKDEQYKNINFFEQFAKDLILNNPQVQ